MTIQMVSDRQEVQPKKSPPEERNNTSVRGVLWCGVIWFGVMRIAMYLLPDVVVSNNVCI